MRRKKLILSLTISLILTLFIRFTLYVEDCNLLVLSGTFVIIFLIILTLTSFIFKSTYFKNKKSPSSQE